MDGKQIAGISNSFIASADEEFVIGNKNPTLAVTKSFGRRMNTGLRIVTYVWLYLTIEVT